MYVFTLDTNKKPLDPVHPGKARKLLDDGEAAVFRRYPFTIILKKSEEEPKNEYRLKIDPGSRTTGFAILSSQNIAVFAAELQHRGLRIKDALESRRMLRRGRRGRKTRYRKPRFLNRTRPKGWLAPSLMSRVHNIDTWVLRFKKLCPITAISVENVRFDTQLMENPEINGVEYQNGELKDWELREYLLEKWGRKCAYCGAKDVPLEKEHIVPRAKGGSNRASNFTISCVDCNRKKGTTTAEEFGFPEIQKKAKQPLKDAAAVNAVRWEVWRRASNNGVPVECGTGGRTKYNRKRLDIPKSHWTDALCVGASTPECLRWEHIKPLQIKAMGYGRRQMCQTDKYGFPKRHRTNSKTFMGFQTGDLVMSSSGEMGRITIRQRPSFTLNGQHIHPKNIVRIQAADGYQYNFDGKEERRCLRT